MIAYILYSKTASDRAVQDFARQLSSVQVDCKLVDADSSEGVSLTENYDLTGRPSVALVAEDGTLVERWQIDLPLVQEVAYLVHK